MFFRTLFLISVLPYLVFPLVFSGTVPPNTEQVRQAILFLANAHIAITLYFYWDRGFAAIIHANRTRYLLAPAAAVLMSAVSFALIPQNYSFVWWGIYTLWQNWHFGRQTYGVYAIVAMDQTPGARVSQFERLLIYFTTAAGSAGALFLVLRGAGRWYELALQTRTICGYATLLAVALGVVLMSRKRSTFNLNRTMFFLFSLLFFTPQYLYPTTEIGFTTYSVSHSLQYLFFLAIVAFNADDTCHQYKSQLPPNLWAPLVFAGLILVGGSIITIRGEFGTMIFRLTGSAALGKLVTGAMFGFVVAHFVIDAHAWRLREKPQREFVLGRFNFLGAIGAGGSRLAGGD